MPISIISIDYQKEFCDKSGMWYKHRPCQQFLPQIFFPYLEENEFKIAEIISDYRLPRPSETVAYCIPGTTGYESAVPVAIKHENTWVKSMNSPEWIRENGGNSKLKAGIPYQDEKRFSKWLIDTIGEPTSDHEIVLIGLTLDCCVLCTAQQLYFRGYSVKVLAEGTDVYDPLGINALIKPNVPYQEALFATTHGMFAKPITWAQLKPKLDKQRELELKNNPKHMRAKL